MKQSKAANLIRPVYEHWKPLSDEQFELAMTDFREFCAQSIVLDQDGRPVKFVMNEAQERFATEVLEAIVPIMAKEPCPSIKILAHKSRQMGITTICLKLEQYILSKVTHFNALHVMPTEPESEELFDRKLLPLLQGTHPDLMPDMAPAGNRVDFKYFEGNLLDNRLSYMSAGAKGSGHGRTIHMLVEDEHAKYIDPFTFEAGVIPAMRGNTIRIVIFTAKGMNHSYDLSESAQDPESDWVYIFLPWYILSDYEIEPYGKYLTLKGLSDYDMFLFREFERVGIPKEKWLRKAAWYNRTLINDAHRDWKYMYENYPTVAEESFKASGSPIFDSAKLRDWANIKYKRMDVFYEDGHTVFRESEEGAIRVREDPIRGHQYLIGADMADGEVDGDDSALCVWDITGDKIKTVAAYNGVMSQNDFAELTYDLGTRYNYALVVPERNVGQLMIKWLTEVKGYMNIWTDSAKVSNYNNLGVYMTPAIKNEAIARMKYLINNDYYEDFDPAFGSQALYFTYQKTPSGMLKAAAAGNHKDDSVMARMSAVMALDMDRFGAYTTVKVKEGRKY